MIGAASAMAVPEGGDIGALRRRAAADPDAALPEVARRFEALLTKQMLSAMRATSFGDDGAGKHADTWRGMMDGELAQTLAGSGRGLGLAEALVAQLRAGPPQDAAAPADTLDMNRLRDRMPALRAVEAAPAGDAADRVRSFVARIRPHAEAVAEALGVPARAVIAHAALESGWGAHAPGDNYFGIKADARWQGARSERATLEHDGSALRAERADFRDYGGVAQGFADYAAFLRGNPRYADALRATDGAGFLQAVAEAGYATDPDYAAKLSRVHDSPLLDAALDNGTSAGGQRL